MSSDRPRDLPDDVDESEETPEPMRPVDSTEDGREGSSPRILVLASLAFAVAAFLVAAVFGVQWWVASADDNAELAAAREDVVRTGSAAVRAFTELDHTKPDDYFNNQIKVATPELAKQIEQGRDANKKTMLEAKTTATTKILDIAVEELNEHEGKARFLAAIQVTVKQGDQSSVKPMRLEVQMTRIDENGEQVWKLANIDQVPVVSAGK